MASNARNLSKLLGTSTQVPTTALPQAIADLETIGTSLTGGDIAPKNISSNTLTQSFDSNQTVNFIMSDSIDTISPIISVFKEVPQPGVSSKGNWDVNANATNYDFYDEKPISYSSVSLTPSATGDGTFTSSNPVISGYVIANASLDTDSFDPSSQETSPQGLDISPDGTKLIVVGDADDALDYYTLSTPFDLSSATYDGTTSAINSNPYGCRFSSTGHKIFVSRNQADDVYEIPLSTNYDASTAGAFQSSGNLTTLSGNAQADFNGIHFSSDGTKMFSCDEANNKVHEYTLSTAWDITTLSYVHAFDISSQDTIVNDLAFTDDGTRMFILGSQTGYIYEYGLTQAWDVSSASYSNISLAQTNGRGMTFSNSGQKMYLCKIGAAELIRYSTSSSTAFNSSDVGKKVVGNSGTAVITSTAGAYTSVTPFADTSAISSWQLFGAEGKSDGTGIQLSGYSNKYDLVNATYTTISPYLNQAEGYNYMSFKPDGTKVWVGGQQSDTIYEYNLGTGFDLSTITYSTSFAFATSSQSQGFAIKSDGTRAYIQDFNSAIRQLDLSTAWNISTATFNSVSLGTTVYNKGLYIKPDGTKLYTIGTGSNIREYTLSTPWDLSNYSLDNTVTLASPVTSNDIYFSADGTKFFVPQSTGGRFVNAYSLSTAWDTSSTITFITSFSLPEIGSYTPQAVSFNTDGSAMYVINGENASTSPARRILEYATGSTLHPYSQYSPALTNSSSGQINSSSWTDINSMTSDETKNSGDIFYAVSTDNRASWGVAKASDGVRKIARNNSGTWQYNNNAGTPVLTGYDFTNFAYDNVTASTGISGNNEEIRFNNDGTKLYILSDNGPNGDGVYQFSLSTAYDISTLSYDSVYYNSTQGASVRDIQFNADGTKMFILHSNTKTIYRYSLSTAFNVGTASYDNVSLLVNYAAANAPMGFFFNGDATKLYLIWAGGSNSGDSTIYERQLPGAYDISSATAVSTFLYNEPDLPAGTTEAYASSGLFNNDGTKMYLNIQRMPILSNTAIIEYDLSTAYDLTTISRTSIQYLTTGTGNPGAGPRGMAWNGDGTKLITLNEAGNLFRFTSSGSTVFSSSDVGKKVVGNSGTAVITSTAGAYTSVTPFADTSAISSWQLYGAEGKSDGTGIQLSGYNSGYDLSNASYTTISPLLAQSEGYEYMHFKPDGTKVWIGGPTQDTIYEYDLSTGFDLSTITYGRSFAFSTSTQSQGFFMKSDGTRAYISDYTSNIHQLDLSTAWDITTASYSNVVLNLGSGNYSKDIYIKSDGTKLYNVDNNNVMKQFTMTTPWDLSTATLDHTVTLADSFTYGSITFNSDGTILFIAHVNTSPAALRAVNSYSLSTAWDISSTLTLITNYDIFPQIGGHIASGISFNTDGTKMFIIDAESTTTSPGRRILEYSTGSILHPYSQYSPALTNSSTGQINSSSWLDINSMTADETKNNGDVFYAVSTDNRTSWGVAKASDGVRKIARNNSGTWQYNNDAGTTVSVGFDIANASYDNKSFSVTAQEVNPRGIDISADGTVMIMIGNTSDDIFYYTLSTPFDVSTASYTGFINQTDTVPNGCRFGDNGTKIFVPGNSGAYKVESIPLSTAYDVSTAGSSTLSSSLNTLSSGANISLQDVAFKTDGTKMYILDFNDDQVHEYSLSTAWDISTLTYTTAFSIAAQELTGQGLDFSSDGTKMFVVGQSNDTVYQYNLSTAWDVSSASYSNISFSVSAQETGPGAICFGDNGQKMYIVGTIQDTFYQYSTGSTTIGYGTSETWVNGTNNNEHATLQQALTSQSFNRMNKAQLDAVADGYHFSQDSADTLDLMIAPYAASGASPVSDGVTINYDAEALIREAVAGTDYIAEFPSPNRLDIKSLINGNLKIRAQ